MKRICYVLLLLLSCFSLSAQERRRPVDSEHPMWLIHVDVWNKADPQKIIDLIPENIRPYVVMNLSLSCQYDTEKNVYKMPQNAMKTYKSWGSVCQLNGMWFTCQPASGGHTHIMDDDLVTFEYMFKTFPNFLGWNYAEQFWGFDEAGDKSSSTQASRIELFAKLVEMSHKYGGFLTISFCGNIWSHALNPVGMMKRNSALLANCKKYPESILWLYKYTTSSCFYNNESVTWSPFVAGLATNYGVRYDNCGWNGALDALLGENSGRKYPNAAGYGTVMEQTCVNGGAVWDGPELIWTEDFQNLSNSTVDGFTRRNWGIFDGFRNGWLDMFSKVVDGTMYIPTRKEVVEKTKIYVTNNVTSGNDEDKYAAWGDLYDGLYKQDDPFNRGNGQWMDNFCYFKKTGRYGAIPVGIAPYDSLANAIPAIVNKSSRYTRWSSQTAKVNEFNKAYPEVSKGDLYVNRFHNQLVTYTPYTYLNKKKSASAIIPLRYNTCDTLVLNYGKLSTGMIHEYADSITFYLNNFRADTTALQTDELTIKGATAEPTLSYTKRTVAASNATVTGVWDEATHSYKVTVKHNGPLDITVHCSGAGVVRATDVVSNTALDMPKQPEVYYGPVTIEAEDMDYTGVKSCVTDPYGWYPSVYGHAGNGFQDMGTGQSKLRHKIKLNKGGVYRVSVRYTNLYKAKSLSIQVNDQKKSVTLAKTQTNQWLRGVAEFDMVEGVNTLNIVNTTGVGIYIDNVTYSPIDVPEERYAVLVSAAAHGTVEAAVDSASEGETVKLIVTPDEGYRLKSWEVIHGNITVPTEGDIAFVMPDDNVILRALFEEANLTYVLDYSNVLSGTIPAGWRCTQENNDVHEYPNNYSSGARTFSGFSGYQGAALYWREVSCVYGRQSAYPLNLTTGHYKWTFAMAAWKESPKYRAQLLDNSGKAVVNAPSLSAAPNAAGSTTATVKSAKEYVYEFDVTQEGKHYIEFTNLDAVGGFDEFLLLECKINKLSDLSGITDVHSEASDSDEIYTLSGTRINDLRSGINIVRTSDGTVKKVLVK